MPQWSVVTEEQASPSTLSQLTPNLSAFTAQYPIIISDDDPQIIRLYQMILDRHHLHSIASPTSQGALDLAHHHTASLIISDMMKPYMSGMDLLRSLRSESRTLHTPFMMITATPRPELRAEFATLGGDVFRAKPIDLREFITLVTKLLQHQPVTVRA